MSTTTLDPTVARKLRQFGRRRLQLLIVRGLCAAIVTFLVCMAIVALIDWCWVLTDRARWTLSLSGYALTAIVVWFTSLSRIVRSPQREEIATHVEDAEPELRENLLSAVELATDDPASVHDSPVFRGLLQGKVAQQMAGIRIGKLLPIRLLAKWLLAAIVLVVGVATILNMNDARFRTLAVRAVLPGANIDRVSRIHVDVLEPSPASLTIAKDETVAIIVDVSGGDVDEVTLETITSDGKTQQQLMRFRTDAEFAANLHVTADITHYRILAGDAVTKKHTITGKDRPRVIKFHKRYHYPDYAQLEDETVAEDNGDILVLAGTQTELRLETDQPVAAAELRIAANGSDEITAVPFSTDDDGQWCVNVPIEDPAIYKVHLVGKDTGFENVFSPRYEIRPIPDLIPRAGFVDQRETDLLLPHNDILALRGMADDDLPLVSLEQEISINGREWQSFSLAMTSAPIEKTDDTNAAPNRVTTQWEWDLLSLNLRTGDQVTTRLVATDRKGNRGESVPIRIVVSAPSFDPNRHHTVAQKTAVYDSLAGLSKLAEENKKSASEITKRLKQDFDKPNTARPEEEQSLDQTTLLDLATKTREQADAVRLEIEEVTRHMPSGADAYDLELTGRIISRLQLDHSSAPQQILQTLNQTSDAKDRRKSLDELKRTFDRSADDAKSAAHHYRNLIAHNIVAAVATDFDSLLKQQELVVNSATQTWSRLTRQQTVVLRQLEVVERLLEQHRPKLQGNAHREFERLNDWSMQRRDQLEQSMESEDQLPQLKKLSQQLLRDLQSRQRIDVADGGIAERLNQARREFDKRSGSLSEPLNHLAHATSEELKYRVQAADADDSAKAGELAHESSLHSVAIERHLESLEQLRARRSLTQARQDADAQFAADAGLTHRATTWLLHRSAGDPKDVNVSTAFREIAPAYHVLEAGHDVRNVQICLEHLMRSERWGSQELAGRIDHPRQWDVVYKGLEEAINKLRRAKVDHKLMQKFDAFRWDKAAREISRRIGQRRWKREEMIGATANLTEYRDQLTTAADGLKPVMAEARATIAKYAPTIPQMAKQAAEQVRKLEEETTQLAEATEQEEQPDTDQPAEQTPELADLKQQQDRINNQIDDLFEALVEDANKQDLLDDEQRERARDADDSIAMVQEPAQQMNEALEQAEQTQSPKDQAKELAKATEQQEKTAQALETVAEHFDRLKNDMNVAETRAKLRQHEREMGIAGELNEQTKELQQLADRASAKPEDLIKELEAELARNPAMQEALSEISQRTLQEARNALNDSANREQEIQRANERSDKEFQQKKKTLAENLRKLGREAQKLSNELVAQADSSASQAKTPEAQKNFREAREKLNEAANAGNSSNEGELQSQLAKKLAAAQEAIKEAAEKLKEAKDQSEAGKNEEIHNDDKARENAKKDQENRRKQFMEQRKRNADNDIRRAQSDEKNANNKVKQADQQVDSAKKKLKSKPDDNNLKRQVQQAESRKRSAEQRARQYESRKRSAEQRVKQEEARKESYQARVDEAKANRDEVKKATQETRKKRDQLNKIPQPPLNDKNPAAQLAEAYAGEATQVAEELAKNAEELAKNVDFGNEVTPSKQQLANAEKEQQDIQQDVKQTAQDLARAARHENRLEKPDAANALQQASDNVEKVANNEATEAQEKLASAKDSAAEPQKGKPSKGESEKGKPAEGNNKPALAANQAVAESEQAIADQAENLTAQLDQQAQAAAAQQAASEGEPQSGQPGEPQSGTPGEPQQLGTPQPGEQQASNAQPGQPQSLTPEQRAAGRELAQTLDALDRMQSQPGQDAAEQTAMQQALAQAARARQGQIASERAKAQQETALADPTAFNPEGMPAYEGSEEAFVLQLVNRNEEGEWGKLRDKAVDDLTKGRRETVSEDYRKSVEAYFQVLAERARRKSK